MSAPPEVGKAQGEDRKNNKLRISECNDEFEIRNLSCSFDSEGSTESTQYSTDDSLDGRREEERDIFKKARHYLNPGWFFRLIVYLFAERKLIVFFWIHFMSTMVIWAHFALIKFEEQLDTVPEGAPRYWLKVLAPTLEFGSMHAILFQMALIPMTMCRFSIAALSESFIDKIVPLNQALRMHIHLGYTMITILFLATGFFFVFFGVLCADGDQQFCDKFKSEIMITGYVILSMLLIIGGTSYFRHKIPYELFYGIHHLVFIMYFITIAHTLDVQQRTGMKERSQTFKWFSSTLLFYFCDRAAMHLNHKYQTRLLGSSVVTGSTGSKMVILKLSRPVLFRFKPGQYAFLRVNEIDNSWHPFAIASYPDSSQLEFYIEVYEGKAWTKKLWDLLEANNENGAASSLQLIVEVMGPYGTSLAKTEDYSHILAVGAGTGIVPILSLYKQHVRNLLRLEPKKFFKDMRECEKKVRQMELAEELRQGSLAKISVAGCLHGSQDFPTASRHDKLSSSIRQRIARHDELLEGKQLRGNMKELKKAASRATRSIYGVVLLTSLPAIGISLFALTVSWNTIPIEVYPGMVEILKIFTMVFQSLFAVIAVFIWDGNNLLAYVDVVMCLVSPFADWYWSKVCDKYGTLRPVDITTYSILTLYMTFRFWSRVVMPRHSTWHRAVSRGAVSKVDKLNFVWTTRSASQVSEILPDIIALWDLLVASWGLENVQQVCKMSIYVTDTDSRACAMLRREVQETRFYKAGGIKFRRADLSKVIEDHSIDLISNRRNSQSLLAFCGSPALARELHHHKISNDMVVAVTGNEKHQMEFVSESYGGGKSSTSAKVNDEADSQSECMKLLTTRKNMSYLNGRGMIRRSSLIDLRGALTFGGSRGSKADTKGSFES